MLLGAPQREKELYGRPASCASGNPKYFGKEFCSRIVQFKTAGNKANKAATSADQEVPYCWLCRLGTACFTARASVMPTATFTMSGMMKGAQAAAKAGANPMPVDVISHHIPKP